MKILKLSFLLCCLTSCVDRVESPSTTTLETPAPEQIVVISKNAPGRYPHLVKKDSLGEVPTDSVGPIMFLPHYGFSYLDSQNAIQTWIPEEGIPDTLVIPYYRSFLELASYNPYTAIRETFLIKNGDTVVFDFEANLPVAKVTNR